MDRSAARFHAAVRGYSCDLNGTRRRVARIFAGTRVRFESAVLAFDDPYAITVRDPGVDEEERWITIGAIGTGSVLLVVHTHFERAGEKVIPIISARRVESHERKVYEEAHQSTVARHPRHRRSKGRGD
ncbi:MAG: BrnT family toxin [Candidatus Acidiferrales bacterium]